MKKHQTGYTLTEMLVGILFAMFFIIGGVGYVANIVKLFYNVSEPITIEMILRVVGIFAFPLGAILGYL